MQDAGGTSKGIAPEVHAGRQPHKAGAGAQPLHSPSPRPLRGRGEETASTGLTNVPFYAILNIAWLKGGT